MATAPQGSESQRGFVNYVNHKDFGGERRALWLAAAPQHQKDVGRESSLIGSPVFHSFALIRPHDPVIHDTIRVETKLKYPNSL